MGSYVADSVLEVALASKLDGEGIVEQTVCPMASRQTLHSWPLLHPHCVLPVSVFPCHQRGLRGGIH